MSWPSVQPWMQEVQEGFMPDTAIIYTQEETPVVGETGSSETTVTVRVEGVSCRLSTLSGQEIIRAAQLASEANATLTLPAGTEILGSDRIVVTRAASGEQFDCQVMFSPKPAFETAKRVLVKIPQYV